MKKNLCSDLNCPFNKKQGCDRFSVSQHCPVGFLEPGYRNPNIEANKYWLFYDGSLDIEELQEKLNMEQNLG